MTWNSSILFMAPIKKMMRSWDIPMVIRLHRNMGEKTELRNETASEKEGGEGGIETVVNRRS